MITSLQNDRVKLAYGLQTGGKSRRKLGKIVLEGVRLIGDAISAGYFPDFVLYDPAASGNVRSLSIDAEFLFEADPHVIQHLASTEHSQGVIAVFPMPTPSLPRDPQRLLILDAVRDPGNLGTILRTSAAAGVDAVLLAPGCVDAYNDKALRAGMGAHFRVPVLSLKWDEIAAECEGLTVYLAEMSGDVPYDAADWSHGWALIVGGEAHGAGENAAALAVQRVYIPMSADTESLNAAAAAAILLFEAARQGR